VTTKKYRVTGKIAYTESELNDLLPGRFTASVDIFLMRAISASDAATTKKNQFGWEKIGLRANSD
jgi:hypothetical protein